ncbi:uncharacterized protein PV09_07701 [Verruconis gallopava]|uniref:DUF7165 domain-containing protein n=1 Tax=Verruconis gallopava TaxID=253628 RepID=A0A0D1XET4_9PEZI|nr:uncharacterized protein PV09_07701 [Verruconis gallopava]KIW00716.1 hypothetical protein PV09_07701 [Verruconis gallopava]
MGENDSKSEHGIAIDAFISAQHDSYKSTIMSAPEMTETSIRVHTAPGPTPGNATGDGDGTSKTARRHKPYSKTTVVRLVSTNATSSAFPESLGLALSVNGRWLAAFSSSALYVISTEHLPAYKNTCRAFHVRRKPLAVSISDSGRFAVLTTSHKIDVYYCEHGDLLKGACKKLETIHLDNEAKTLAFSWCGEIVAAGSDVGLEIKNLSPGSMETDKRYITCSALDRLMFSKDSRALLATSVFKKSRYSTFISLNDSFEDAFVEEVIEQQPLGKLWITQLLFPERVKARQAALLPTSNSDLVNSEILAFDSHLDQFKVYDVTMKRFTSRELGTPEEVVWTRHHKPEESVPAISEDASTIAVAVRSKVEKEIWVYHVPPSWWEPAHTGSPESESSDGSNNALDAAEKIKLFSISEGAPPETITNLQWVQTMEAEIDRLVALVSTSNIVMPEEVVPIEAPAASGKLFLIDFLDNTTDESAEQPPEVLVDLGELTVSEDLTDEVLELDREVDLVRRRTQIQRSRPPNRPPANPIPSPRGSLRRSLSSGGSGGVPTLRGLEHSNSGRSTRRRRSFSSLSTNEEREEAVVMPVDEPYSQSQPRSYFTLHRAATIAANAPATRQHLRALPDRPLEYRRADGLREIPHESDADNWVPPPPVYSEEPDNVVSHPVSANPQAVAAYVPQAPKPPSLMQNRLSRPLSGVPPVSAIPLNPSSTYATQSQAYSQGSAVLAQHPGSSSNASTMQQLLHPRSRTTRPGSSHMSASASSLQASSQMALDSLQTSSSRIPNHRNADSASSTSSRTSHNTAIFQPGQQSTLNANIATSAPVIPLVTQGLPPNMTAPSPIAEFVRPPATRRDTPSPASPIVDQVAPPHRRSGSGSSPTTGALLGACTDATPHAVSSDLTRSLPSVPTVMQESSRRSLENNSPSSRRTQRPVLNRLATIASVSEQRQQNNFIPEPIIHSASTPTTTDTFGRRQWWRIGAARTPRAEGASTPMQREANGLRPGSRIMQYAPIDQPRHAATAPATAPTTGSKTKEKDGGSRCAIM